jgi:hypothetical protein
MNDPNDWQSRMPSQPVTDLAEIMAVWEGEVDGFVYTSDDEVWADVQSLERWRASPKAADSNTTPT